MAGYEDKNTIVGVQTCDKTVSLELNGEISLPDYLGEVSRLLWVRPTILPPAKFLNGESAELSGRVCYQALYAGADGKLYSAALEDAYSFSVEAHTSNASLLSVQVVPDVVIGRVASPRKLTVRCRAHAHVEGYGECDLSVPSVGEQTCRLGELQESGTFLSVGGDEVELYDELDAQDMRVISSRGEVFLPEVSTFGGGVRSKGEVMVTLLCDKADEQECPFVVVRRLPLQFEVPLELSGEVCEASATAVVCETRAVTEEEKITLAVRVLPRVELTCKTTACYTRDLFVPSSNTECSFKDTRVFVPKICTNKNFSVSAALSKGELGVPSAAAVIDACAEAQVLEKSCVNGNTLISGELHCHVLYRFENEYGVAGADVPFRTTLSGETEALLAVGSVPVCRIEEEGERVRLNAEVLLALRGSAFASVKSVESARVTARETGGRADLELCYPAHGSSLWEIAKQYATSPESIAAANGISDENMGEAASLSGVRYLMIP